LKEKDLECIECGHIMTIQRKNSKNRATGHIKHLWCIRCKKRTRHIELDEFKSNFMKSKDRKDKELEAMAKGVCHG